jgi:hypothetical protein
MQVQQEGYEDGGVRNDEDEELEEYEPETE